jgi:hypothetical protein
MNYADEDYVRYYTRSTVTWLALEYEGQVVMSLMLRGVFNRSGIFDCGGHEPSHAVTLAIRCPEQVAQKGLKRLLDTGTWVLNDGQIIWPNYVEAQTCKRSDRARKRESRENLARQALGNQSHLVTRGHDRSHTVTPKHKPKQKPRHKPKQKGESSPPVDQPASVAAAPVEPQPEPIQEAPEKPTLTLQQRAALWLKDVTRASYDAWNPGKWPETQELDQRVRKVWGITRNTNLGDMGDPRVKNPVKRWAEGCSQQDLLDAIDGSAGDRYLKDNPAQRSLRWILDNPDRVQEFMLKVREKAPAPPALPKPRRADPDEEILAARLQERNLRALEGATSEEIAAAEGKAKAIVTMAGSLFRG